MALVLLECPCIIFLLPQIKPTREERGRAGLGRPPPIGGRGRHRGHRCRDEAAAAGHSAPSPPARTTFGPASLPGLSRAREPGTGSVCEALRPAQPAASRRETLGPKPAFQAFLPARPRRNPRLVEMCMSSPTRSECIGHCEDKKQKM